ncbi:MAG: hypothetical protein WAP51_02755 [Candidatus Sungiibacteriota bacterium]
MIFLIFISIIKAVVAWFIIVYLGTNFVGMIGRGFFEKPLVSGNHAVTLMSILATIGICIYLYYYWGILFLIAIVLVMISRIPDLYWEVRILPKELGVPYPVPKDLIRKAIKSKNSNNPFSNILLTSLTWVALVVLFVAFFIQK